MKLVIQTGFEKKAYPRFDGNRLKQKQKWIREVHPERQNEDREVSNLRDALCKSAQNKVIDCQTLDQVWEVLDRQFGNLEELRTSLKLRILQIKLKANSRN